MKKILSLILVLVFSLTMFLVVGCGDDNNGGNTTKIIDGVDLTGVEYNKKTGEMYVGNKEGKTRIKVAEHLAGYGEGWILSAAKDFLLDPENANYYMVIDADSSLTASMESKLGSGRNLADVYFSLSTSWQEWAAQGYLANLDDLYDSVIPGEDKKVKEKVNDVWNTYSSTYSQGEKHSFAFPWTDNITGIVYNETMFEQYGWSVPTTVSELIALCERIVKDTKGKVAPFTYPGSNQGYFDFLGTTWWLQIAGIEGMQQYMNFDSYEVYNPDKPLGAAKLAALETFQSVFGPDVIKKYTLKGSNGKDNKASQISFANGEAAMIPNGNWIEKESRDAFIESGIKIKMMRVPYADDAEKDKDGNYIKVSYGATVDFAIIPSEASNIEGGKRFLLFMCKDEQLKKFSSLTGGVRPFDYDVSSLDTSDFFKSCLDIWANSEKWFDASESVLYTSGAAKKFLTDNPYMNIVYDEYDAETFCYTDYAAAKREWNNMLEKAGLK